MQVDAILDAQAASAQTVVQTLIACEMHSNRVFTSSPHHSSSLNRLKAALTDATKAYRSGEELKGDSKITFAEFGIAGKVRSTHALALHQCCHLTI